MNMDSLLDGLASSHCSQCVYNKLSLKETETKNLIAMSDKRKTKLLLCNKTERFY